MPNQAPAPAVAAEASLEKSVAPEISRPPEKPVAPEPMQVAKEAVADYGKAEKLIEKTTETAGMPIDVPEAEKVEAEKGGEKDELYKRYKEAAQTVEGGGNVSEEETKFFETLEPDLLQKLRDRRQKEEDLKSAEKERQKISPAEIAHDRQTILQVVEGVKKLAETEDFVYQGNFKVEGTPDGVNIHGYSTKFDQGKGGHYSLLAVNGENIVVGFYDFNIGKWPDGGHSASGKILVDVEARNKGLGRALKRSMDTVCQSEANKQGVTIVSEAANQNSALGRFQEQKRWQKLFLKRDIFEPKTDGLQLEGETVVLKKDGTISEVASKNDESTEKQQLEEIEKQTQELYKPK